MSQENTAAEVEVETSAKIAKKVTGVTKESAITILTEENPKRPSSKAFARFEGYLTDPAPTTVGEALENGLTIGDIKFDFVHGFIHVEGAEITEYEVSPRGPRTPKEEGDDIAKEDSDAGRSDVIAEAEDEDF